MKSISKDKVLRWVSGQQSQGGSGGGGVSVDLAGYATQIWTEQNYVNKDFFSSLFKAYDADGNEVLPNDTETTIDNIKAMFGFWTDFYISALGNGGQQSVDLCLAQLADVNVAGVTNGQVLTYNAGMWIPGDAGAAGNFLPLTGGTLTGTLIFSGIATDNWTEGIRINDATNGWTALTMGGTLDSGTAAGIWSLHTYQGTFYLGHNGSNDATYGLSFTQAGALNLKTSALTNNGQVVIDQSNIGSQTVNKANFLNADDTQGASNWVWNPLNLTQYYVWGQQFANSYLSGDTGDMRLYLASINEAGGLGICMNIDGYVSSLSGFYTDGGYKKGGSSDSYVLLGGGGHAAISALSVNYANSAGRLSGDSSYTAWGQTFWSYGTPNSISGAMSSVTNIDAIAYFDTSNSRLGIGTNSPSNTLHVNGIARVSSLYIGNILITADSNGIYVSNGGLSANTYVTALGQGSQSSSIYLSQLGDVNTSGASNGQALVYRGGTWVPETISSGGGSYLPLSGGTMTGTIVTPDNDNEGIIPAANNYGQVGSSSRYFYRMYATTYYGTTFVGNLSGTAASASALTSAGRSTLISDSNEFNFLSSSNSTYSSSLHFNYKAANGGNTSTAVAEYVFDNGQGTTLAYLNSTGAHAGSDIRRKNIKEYFALDVDDIADAPVIKYTWKDIDDGLHAGSVAQYWQQVLPECVGKHGSSEYLSMNYADIALVSVISLAREVIRLRKEIENLIHNKA